MNGPKRTMAHSNAVVQFVSELQLSSSVRLHRSPPAGILTHLSETYTPSMSTSVHLGASTLQNYVNDFFQSLQGDDTTLTSFVRKMSSLGSTFRIQCHSLPEETASAGREFFQLVEGVLLNLINLESSIHRVHGEALVELEHIITEDMRHLSISDTNKSLTKSNETKPYPAYIKPSYKWLLANLHNPYPSKEVKKEISRTSNCTIKDIDAWFVDARKRIGWNKLRKTKFSNKQESIIAAATHCLRPTASSFADQHTSNLLCEMNPLDLYRPDFLMISQTAKSLYSGRFPDLVPFLDCSVDNASIPRKGAYDTDLQPSQSISFAYPTPESSPRDPFAEDELRAITEISPSNLRKRPQSVLDSYDNGIEIQSAKRRRYETGPISNTDAIASLPSPPNTSSDAEEDSATSVETVAPEFSASVNTQVNVQENVAFTEIHNVPGSSVSTGKRKRGSSDDENDRRSKVQITTMTEVVDNGRRNAVGNAQFKRKRRLSDGESQCLPKRPHHAFCKPRLQTASNPLPVPASSVTLDQDDANLLDLSDTPSLTSFGDPISSNGPLNVFEGHYDISGAFLDEGPFTFDDIIYPLPSLGEINSCSELGNPISHLETLRSPLPSFPSTSGLDDHPDPIFDIGLGSLDMSTKLVPTPAYDVPLPSTNTFFHDSSLDWSLLNPFIPFDLLAQVNVKPSDFNHSLPGSLTISRSCEEKRAKIQALNEEIRRLEAEL